ncbi:hypothetical protein WME75_00665 [Sorangium sp. So ce1014]|uniref:hypothetical protein n=1 Tax=Sorangium sp. So ce1014 TaxID=3133326 RepID=UPI003F62E7F5
MRRAALLLPIALVAACAGAPAPQHGPVAPLPPAPRAARAQPALAAAQPVTAPEGLSAVLRIADPQRSWSHVTQLMASTPFGVLLFSTGPRGPEMLLEQALGPALADVVDLDKPIDVAWFGITDPELRPVVSLSVAEQEVPRLHERFVLKEHRGMLRVEGVRDADPDEETPRQSCAFEPGERRGGARLLCAKDAKDVDAAAPYLVEVVGREPIEADARLEIMEWTLREVMKSPDDADGDDGPTGALGREIGDAFMRDLESMSMDLRWGRAEVDIGFSMRFASRRSPLTLAFAPAVAPDAAPPPAFLRLPGDTAVAFYTQGASRAELTPLRDVIFPALRDDLMDDGYDAAALDRLIERLDTLFVTGGPIVMGAGGDRAAAERALAAYQGGKGAARSQKAVHRALQSWILVAVEEPAQTWIPGMKELLLLGEELDRLKASPKAAGGAGTPGGAPEGRASKDEDEDEDKDEDEDEERTTPVIVRAPATLPAGTLHVELRSKPLTKDAPPAHTTHFYVVPAGQRTWFGIGENDAAVVARLRVAADPGRDERTLAAAPGLEALRQPGTLAGGLFSLAGLVLLGARGDTPEALGEAAKELAGLATLPARGEVSIPLAVTSEVLGSGAARVTARVRLPLTAIHDAIALGSR